MAGKSVCSFMQKRSSVYFSHTHTVYLHFRMEKCSTSTSSSDDSTVVFASYKQAYAKCIFMDSVCIWILIYGLKAENNACTHFAPSTNESPCSQILCRPKIKILFHIQQPAWLFSAREQKSTMEYARSTVCIHCLFGAMNGRCFRVTPLYPAVSASVELVVALQWKT